MLVVLVWGSSHPLCYNGAPVTETGEGNKNYTNIVWNSCQVNDTGVEKDQSVGGAVMTVTRIMGDSSHEPGVVLHGRQTFVVADPKRNHTQKKSLSMSSDEKFSTFTMNKNHESLIEHQSLSTNTCRSI